MKSAEEFYSKLPYCHSGHRYLPGIETIMEIQSDAFKAGQEATMKWVGEECRRQTERLIEFQQKPEPLF